MTNALAFNEDLYVVELPNGTWEARLDVLNARSWGATRDEALTSLAPAIARKLAAMSDEDRELFVLANTTPTNDACGI